MMRTTGLLLISIGIVLVVEFVRQVGPSIQPAQGLMFFPALAYYELSGLAVAGIVGLAARLLGSRRAAWWGFWAGLSLILSAAAVVWVADNFGGLPLLGGSRLKATAAAGLIALGAAGAATGLAALAGRIISLRTWSWINVLFALILLPLAGALTLGSLHFGWHTRPPEALLRPQPPPEAAPAGPNLLLISIDALRSDFLPAYGEELVKTTHIDRLLDGGFIFERARSTASLTLPGHTGILTGRHPGRLGVLSNRSRLPEGVETLAQALARAGLATGAVVSSPTLDPQSGIGTGFAEYRAPYPRYASWFHDFLSLSLLRLTKELLAGDAHALSNAETADEALDLLQKLGRRRFFLFVHFWGVHDPYRPPGRFYTSPQRSDSWLERLSHQGRYRGELLYVDEQLGRLFAWLDQRGLWDKTAVILTADHGEGLGQHGYMYHAREVYEEQLRVPLIVHPAGARGPTERLFEPVQTTAIPGLVLEVLGGQAWPGAKKGIFLSLATGGDKWAVTDGRRKLIFNREAKTWQAFDLKKDPAELKNLASPEAPWPDLAQGLSRWLAELKTGGPTPVAPERENALKALGYL